MNNNNTTFKMPMDNMFKPKMLFRKKSFSARWPLQGSLALDVDKINEACSGDMSYTSNCQVYTQICSKITNNIFLGGSQIAQNFDVLTENCITHIINCASTIVPSSFQECFQYLNLPLFDNHSQDITGYFYHTFNFIDDAIAEGGKVLIHCEKGVSRSPSILIAYLAVKNDWSYDKTEKFIKEARSCIDPNIEFVFQIQNWILQRPHNIQALEYPVVYHLTCQHSFPNIIGPLTDYNREKVIAMSSSSDDIYLVCERSETAVYSWTTAIPTLVVENAIKYINKYENGAIKCNYITLGDQSCVNF